MHSYKKLLFFTPTTRMFIYSKVNLCILHTWYINNYCRYCILYPQHIRWRNGGISSGFYTSHPGNLSPVSSLACHGGAVGDHQSQSVANIVKNRLFTHICIYVDHASIYMIMLFRKHSIHRESFCNYRFGTGVVSIHLHLK